MTEKQENKLIACTLFAFGVSGACVVLVGNLMPFLREVYGIGYQEAGFLMSLPSWGNLITIFLAGYLPTYIGRRKTVTYLSVWMGIGFAIIATGLGGAALLPAAFLMIGLARGSNTNFSNTMMSTLPGQKSSIGYNLLHASFAVGAVLSPIILIQFTKNNPMGWKGMTFAIVGMCILQMLVYIRMPLPAENITHSIKAVDKSFLKSRNFWLGTAIMFFYVSTEYAITNWMVTYLKDTGVLSIEISQLMTSLLWTVMFIGRMLGAVLVGKIAREAILVADGAGVMLFFLLVFFGRSEMPIIIGIMGVGLFMATIYTTALALGTASIKGNDLGVSTMILIGSSGGVVTPALVGMVAERAGIQAGMGVVVVVTVLLLATVLCNVFLKGGNDE